MIAGGCVSAGEVFEAARGGEGDGVSAGGGDTDRLGDGLVLLEAGLGDHLAIGMQLEGVPIPGAEAEEIKADGGAVAAEGEGALNVLVLEFVAAGKEAEDIADDRAVEREGKCGEAAGALPPTGEVVEALIEEGASEVGEGLDGVDGVGGLIG